MNTKQLTEMKRDINKLLTQEDRLYVAKALSILYPIVIIWDKDTYVLIITLSKGGDDNN